MGRLGACRVGWRAGGGSLASICAGEVTSAAGAGQSSEDPELECGSEVFSVSSLHKTGARAAEVTLP